MPEANRRPPARVISFSVYNALFALHPTAELSQNFSAKQNCKQSGYQHHSHARLGDFG